MTTQVKQAKVNKVSTLPSKAKKQIKQVSTEKSYKNLVLETNKSLKINRLKLGYCIDDLLKLDTLPINFKTYLNRAKKDSVTYKIIETNVKQTKKGFNAFYLLQYLYKNCK